MDATIQKGLDFLTSQLTATDATAYLPLSKFTALRDVKFRKDVTFSNTSTLFTRINLGGGSTGIPYVNSATIETSVANANGTTLTLPINFAEQNLMTDFLSVQRAMNLHQNIENLQTAAINRTYQNSIDQSVYVGDKKVNTTGLLNNPNISAVNAGMNMWINPDGTANVANMLGGINELIQRAWNNSNEAILPNRIIVSPRIFSVMATTPVSGIAEKSLLEYILNNNISKLQGTDLKIVPSQYAKNVEETGQDMACCYNDDYDNVRYPLVGLFRQPTSIMGSKYITPFTWGLGVLELVYPEAVAYTTYLGMTQVTATQDLSKANFKAVNPTKVSKKSE